MAGVGGDCSLLLLAVRAVSAAGGVCGGGGCIARMPLGAARAWHWLHGGHITGTCFVLCLLRASLEKAESVARS
jgi:hypothetical protein